MLGKASCKTLRYMENRETLELKAQMRSRWPFKSWGLKRGGMGILEMEL